MTPPGRWTNFSDPLLTTTDPNRGRLRPTRLGDALPEIPVWQSILQHERAPGYATVSLEQNLAYGKALTFTTAVRMPQSTSPPTSLRRGCTRKRITVGQ